MAKWIIKTALQRAISWLPQSHRWNALFQNHFTHSIKLGLGTLQNRAEYCTKTLDAYFTSGKPLSPGELQVLEVGTGWYPVIPVAFYLCGAGKISTFDIAPLLSANRVKEALNLFLECYRSGELKKMLPRLMPDRAVALQKVLLSAGAEAPEKTLARLNIDVFVKDAQQTGLPANSVNVVFSHAVLQHIPRPILKNVFSEFTRVSAHGGVMGHWINMRDLFAVFDPSITRLNCLKFSNRQWRFLNSPLIPQNRLRLSDYRALTTGAAFTILKEEVGFADKQELSSITLAPEFKHYSREDLLAIDLFLVAASRHR